MWNAAQMLWRRVTAGVQQLQGIKKWEEAAEDRSQGDVQVSVI